MYFCHYLGQLQHCWPENTNNGRLPEKNGSLKIFRRVVSSPSGESRYEWIQSNRRRIYKKFSFSRSQEELQYQTNQKIIQIVIYIDLVVKKIIQLSLLLRLNFLSLLENRLILWFIFYRLFDLDSDFVIFIYFSLSFYFYIFRLRFSMPITIFCQLSFLPQQHFLESIMA